jgi:hypothetical protein
MRNRLAMVFAGTGIFLAAACQRPDPENAAFGPPSANGQSAEKAAPARPAAASGPFGIDLARGLQGLDVAPHQEGDQPGVHRLNSVPSPHPDFSVYAVVAYPDVGICEVRAISSAEQDQYGVHAREVVDRLAAALTTRYGEPRKFDRCTGYSCDAEFWTMQLSQGSRGYAYEWDSPREQPGGVRPRSVALSVQAPDILQTYARIDYEFGDERRCEAASRAAGAANL